MREQRNTPKPQVRLRLKRGADGRLRPDDSHDIGDIWAEQQRIKLAEAIAEDKRRTDRKAQRKAKLANFLKRRQPRQTLTKELAVNATVPKLPSISLKKFGKKQLLAAGILVVVLGVGLLGLNINGRNTNPKGTAKNGVLDSSSVQTPEYQVVLPSSKSIEDLGGWKRVSPPDKEPVFAYADRIGQAQIIVSQQPLPESFQKDVARSIKDLAQQFTANERLDIDGQEVYVGTSVKGPQSVIFSTRELLILIKSDSKVPNEEWQAYIQTLE